MEEVRQQISRTIKATGYLNHTVWKGKYLREGIYKTAIRHTWRKYDSTYFNEKYFQEYHIKAYRIGRDRQILERRTP